MKWLSYPRSLDSILALHFLQGGYILTFCRNPTLRECEDETHTPEMGTWESSGTPKTLEFDCRGQNTSH